MKPPATPGVRLDETGKNTFALAGELSFSSVPPLWRGNGRRLMDAAPPDGEVTVDLNGVVRTDSAGIALMIEWLRRARDRNVTLRFRNIPKQMLSLVNLAEVDFLFDG